MPNREETALRMKYSSPQGVCVDSVVVARPIFFQSVGGGSIPTSTLYLRFSEISIQLARRLNFYWHSRLPKTDLGNLTRNRISIAFAAEYDCLFYAVAIWTDPVAGNRLADGKRKLELRRMAISQTAPKNTASRMLGWMVRDIKKRFPDLVGLVSYQDTEVHTGTIYKASGWRPVDTGGLVLWSVNGRVRNEEQSVAKKIRWELDLL